jgi:hypothetical protein
MHFRLLALVGALALGPAGSGAQASGPVAYDQVRVHAHILLVDRTEAARVGLSYVQVGGGLIGVEGARGAGGVRGARGGDVLVGGEVAGVPVSAFIDLARERGVLRSETRSQVLVLSGGSAVVASGTVTTGRWGATRVQGPEFVVIPTVLDDGRVHLDVRVRLRDDVAGFYGHRADGSPVDVSTTVVVGSGEEATVGNVQTSIQRSDTGILRWRSSSDELDVLVVLRPEIIP